MPVKQWRLLSDLKQRAPECPNVTGLAEAPALKKCLGRLVAFWRARVSGWRYEEKHVFKVNYTYIVREEVAQAVQIGLAHQVIRCFGWNKAALVRPGRHFDWCANASEQLIFGKVINALQLNQDICWPKV